MFSFAPARREQVSLLIALAGASGSGKTYSALRLAKGMAPSGKIAFLDTEARRGLHYADQFEFMHADMRPQFRPAAFIEGIRAAESAGAEVVIIDSFSHEYDGEGGIMDWADELAEKGVKSPGNWKDPKLAHKKMMNALLQCRASIIFCLRADEKIEIVRENGKTQVRPLGWVPICEKRFMFEMTASFTLTPDRPGIPHFDLPHKLQSQHRGFFTDKQAISEESGRALAAWAHGGSNSVSLGMGRSVTAAKTAVSSTSPAGETATQSNVRTANEYVAHWNDIINGATNYEQLRSTWVAQADEREKIEWPQDGTREGLQAKVKTALESLK